MSQSENFAVLCVLWALPSQLNLIVLLGNRLDLYFRVVGLSVNC